MKEELIRSLYMKLAQMYKIQFEKQEEDLVFGQGNLEAKLILIGEAPGAEEVRQKKPFVGAAGKNLNHFLEILDLKREDLYITNVVKFRPHKINPKTNRTVNRPPSKKEIETSIPFLKEEMGIIRSKLVVTLGNVPLKALLGKEMTIGEVHGRMQSIDGQQVFPLYHPASILYNPSLKETYEEDVKSLRGYLLP